MPRRFSILAWLLVAASAIVAGLAIFRSIAVAPPGVEVAVLFPSTSTSSWPDFVRGAQLAAEERGLPFQQDADSHRFVIQTSPLPIRFQWYPVIGSFAMQQKIREICQRPDPPIAIVGADNSALTEAIGTEIHSASPSDWRPLLLMTWATADRLIDVNPGRCVRYGFSNRRQAEFVVARLEAILQEEFKGAPLKSIVVQVLDNPFSLNLAENFESQLGERLSAAAIEPPAEFQAPSESGARRGWSLKTGAGDPTQATPEEAMLARKIVDAFIAAGDAPCVLTLAVDLELFRRLTEAIHTAFHEHPRSSAWGDPASRLLILAGDTIDYFDFQTAGESLLPEKIAGRVIFFSHVNPIDLSVSKPPSPRGPSVSLNREVARTLLEAIPALGANPTPHELLSQLEHLDRENSPIFVHRERHRGGGAIVATPKPEDGGFSLSLPQEWKAAP